MNETGDVAFADAYDPLDPIDAVIVQVPAVTNATNPEDELTVQTDVVKLEYVFVPVSSGEAVAVADGFEATLNAYELESEPIANVRLVSAAALKENVRVVAVAEAYSPLWAIEAEIEQSPSLAPHATAPLDELTVQTLVVELEYVMVPEPADAVALIVGGVLART